MVDVAKDVPVPQPEVPGQAEPAPLAATGTLGGGLSIDEVLRASSLRGARVLAGTTGLSRVVQRLNVMEVPDILPWVKPHELLLTTGYPLRDDPESLADLVAALDARGVVGLGIKLGRYLDVLPDSVLQRADELGFPVLQLPDGVGFDDILNQVLSDVLHRQAAVLARAEEVHRALVQIVLCGGGLQEVTDELAAILGGVVAATTPDGRVLAVSGAADAIADAVHGPHFDECGRFRTERSRPGVVPDLSSGSAGGSFIAVPVVAGGVNHGHIAAFSQSMLEDIDVHALERAATVAALVVTKALAVSAVESKYQGDFLRDLVSGRAGSTEHAVPHSASLGWDIDRPLVVVVAELDPVAPSAAPPTPQSVRPAQERFSAAWSSVVRVRDPRAAVVGFAHEVVVLLGVPEHVALDRYVEEVVAAVSGDGGGGRRSFSTGVSRLVASPELLPVAYEQARKAVQVGRQMHGAGAVAHFDGLGVFRLLSLVPDSGELRTFVSETLGELAERTDADAVDRRRTLQVLLETNLNVAETARTLHFHYNTLRYRITKLEKLLGPFTSDSTLRLNLMLALQVLQMKGI
jgi:purine catabolism regulator